MICVSIANLDFEEYQRVLKDIEIAELRLDLLHFSLQQVRKIFALPSDPNQKFLEVQEPFFKKVPGRRRQIRLIATYRPGNISEKERQELLITAVEAGADYVDIEMEAEADFKEAVIDACRKKDCKVIISYHNYEKTPSKKDLDAIIARCYAEGADITKIACQVNSEADAARILSLYDYDKDEKEEKKIVAIGMGEMGKIIRLAAPLLGAPFTYAALSEGKETAPGQLDKETMEEILKKIASGGHVARAPS
jgi:3-dehydroquinate dehydratase-1